MATGRRVEGVIRIENDRIVKRVHVGECSGSRSVDTPKKRRIDTEGVFEEKRVGCQANKENSPGYE